MNQNKDASIMNKDYVWNPRDQVMTKISDDQTYIMIIIMPSLDKLDQTKQSRQNNPE